MPDGLYERDFVTWTERQAALLRRLAAGERVNEAVDWPNLIEEVEDLGRSELNSVTSLLSRALEHLLKLHGWPGSHYAEHWRRETRAFLADAADRWTPGMRQRFDLERLYARAVRSVGADTVDGQPPRALPDSLPFALDDLVVPAPDVADVASLLAKLGSPSPG